MEIKTKLENCVDVGVDQEEWRSVVGYEGFYEVSSFGRVRSSARGMRSLTINPYGYMKLNMSKFGSIRTESVHRLVAEAFLSDWDSSLEVDHIDGNRSNNRISNLRMVTNAENHRAFKKPSKGTTSRFRGVNWFSPKRKWRAYICCDGVRSHIGYFDDEEKAAKAWNKKAVELGFFPEALNQVGGAA